MIQQIVRQVEYTNLLLITTLRFNFVERKISSTTKILRTWLSANFLLLFMSLLTALVVKNSHILTGIYFNFLKKPLD